MRGRSIPARYAARAALIALALLAQGCAADPPRLLQGADPSDPSVRVPAARYRSALGGYASGRPVEPAPWTERKDGAAPKDAR
jgi:hypothetical protein